jgi:nucleotide-binding universal stress UspA family protein
MSPAPAAKKGTSKRKPAASAAKAKGKAAPRAKAKAAPARTPAVGSATATAKPKAKAASRTKPKAAARARAKPAPRAKAPAKPKSKAAAQGACLVVGYDGSASGRAAVAWAAEVLPRNGKIVLVHACRPLHAPTSPLASAAARREFGRALLEELLLEAPNWILDREIVAEVADKDPVSALTASARRHGASGIVVGSQRHSRLRKAIGTVTSDLLKSSPVPVTAVPH